MTSLQKIEGGKIIRVNTKESVCVYCGSKIGTKMKCDGCGTIDPPVTTKPQKIEGGKKERWSNWCKKMDDEIMARVISFVSQIKTGGFGMSVENARNVIKMSETYD